MPTVAHRLRSLVVLVRFLVARVLPRLYRGSHLPILFSCAIVNAAIGYFVAMLIRCAVPIYRGDTRCYRDSRTISLAAAGDRNILKRLNMYLRYLRERLSGRVA